VFTTSLALRLRSLDEKNVNDYGAVVEMAIGKVNERTWRQTSPAPFRVPETEQDVNWN
jgi:hypothetical protein